LTALRVFEAAARHLSFTRAAQELNVTQAAVSHQVKALEDWLGLKLFHRLNRSLLLTDAGQAYLPTVREGFERLIEGTDRLHRRDRGGTLTVTAVASFVAKWLVPRLGRFQARYPEIDVRISTEVRMVDFTREEFDMGIRYGGGSWPGLRIDHLMAEDVFPVCSPDLLVGPHPLTEPADLRHHTLLHDEMREDWRMWLLAAGVQGVDPTRGPGFSQSSTVIQAAIQGLGVALGRSVLVADDLAAGRLVRPFEFSLPTRYGYYVVCAPTAADRPKVAAFRDWLLGETKEKT
jgi:LysR family glycine cleavage system transcriptional activator